MTKMSDVARYAGVSVKTVSRVLNNEPHVRESLRKKVRAAINKLGYVPSASARNLRARRTYRIAVITHSFNSSFIHTIQFGALRACQQHGYQMQVSLVEPERILEPDYLALWTKSLSLHGTPDGVILVSPLSDHAGFNAFLRREGIPIVRIGPNDIQDDQFNIAIDDRAASVEAVQHLIDLGHARIGFVKGKEEQGATHERFRGYRDSLQFAGIPFDQKLVRQGLFSFESGVQAGVELLSLDPRPTAIFAANDDMAAGVSVAARRAGLRLPEDLSVVGFDDSEIAEKMWPGLTTIRQPLQEFGIEAVETLISATEKSAADKERRQVTLGYQFIQRESTASPSSTRRPHSDRPGPKS